MADTKNINPNQERKKTPRKYKVAKDNRSEQDAGKYPYYYSWKTRSGHTFQMDDSKGQETVTLQHRSGSSIQLRADGSAHYTTHNGKYEVIFGEDRITVSGAQDITVKGDASLRVYGDYNVTCHKDYNLTVMGNLNITAKNKNQHIRGNKDTQMKNETKKIEGTSFKQVNGSLTQVSKGAMTHGSLEDKVFMGAASGMHMQVDQGDMTKMVKQGNMHMETQKGKFDAKFSDGSNDVTLLADQGKFHTKAKSDINTESEQGDIQTKATQGDVGVEASAGSVKVKAQQNIEQTATQDIRASATQNVEIKSTQKTDIRSAGEASLHGSTTHVSAQSGAVNVVGTAGGVNVDGGSSLNLNTGAGQMMDGLNLGDLQYSFGSILGATGLPNITGTQASDPEEEPDLSSETDKWV